MCSFMPARDPGVRRGPDDHPHGVSVSCGVYMWSCIPGICPLMKLFHERSAKAWNTLVSPDIRAPLGGGERAIAPPSPPREGGSSKPRPQGSLRTWEVSDAALLFVSGTSLHQYALRAVIRKDSETVSRRFGSPLAAAEEFWKPADFIFAWVGRRPHRVLSRGSSTAVMLYRRGPAERRLTGERRTPSERNFR